MMGMRRVRRKVDGMRQDIGSEGSSMHVEMSDCDY